MINRLKRVGILFAAAIVSSYIGGLFMGVLFVTMIEDSFKTAWAVSFICFLCFWFISCMVSWIEEGDMADWLKHGKDLS